ncbi:hypothetical protein [Pengzhenrongella phosphoraccumulans]|uniref:hypothetical protein n=1 Tax=Pengzhenrongella phosphoraccumulans TaxID=3114394 RepID=UPI00388DD366
MKLGVVLGAGFSKAVDDEFPTVDMLGELVREQVPGALATAPPTFAVGGGFERWLSRIAEPQPDLSEAANLGNARDFQLVTAAIHAQMVGIEHRAFQRRIPWWLLRFLGLLHTTRATVVTFNYDTLVEGASTRMADQETAQMLNTFSLTDGIPETRSGGMYGPAWIPSFRLLKLHGSVDTYWVPGDVAGSTIVRVADSSWHAEGGMSSPNLNIARQAPGRVPFIVPPASAKSAFFTNPITRQLWRTAADRLGACDQIVIIGYSVPLTDLVASAMLVDAQRVSGANIDIVNPDPDTVIQHLTTDAGVPAQMVRAAAASCKEYVDQLERDVSEVATASIQDALGEPRHLAVSGLFGQVHRVVGARVVGREVQLDISEAVPRASAMEVSSWMATASLRELLAESGAVRISITIDGESACVVDHYVWSGSASDGGLLILMPSAIRVPEPS